VTHTFQFRSHIFDEKSSLEALEITENDFMVRAEGPDGELRDYEIKYTFGVDPLQQYLIEFAGGRMQALSLAWDTREHCRLAETQKYPDPNKNCIQGRLVRRDDLSGTRATVARTEAQTGSACPWADLLEHTPAARPWHRPNRSGPEVRNSSPRIPIAVRYSSNNDSRTLNHSRHIHALREIDGRYEPLPEGAVIVLSGPLDALTEQSTFNMAVRI